jgi:hypothetical protein
MASPPQTCLLSALVWQHSESSQLGERKERGSYVVPEDSDCSRRSFTLAGWSEKQNAYYYVPDTPVCSLVYQREYSMPWRYMGRWGAAESSDHNPRFFVHDSGTFAFSNYRFPSEDPVKIWRAATGPPFQFFQTDGNITPNKFFHDDIQLNAPDLPGQPPAGAKHLPCSEADEYGYESDASDSSLELKCQRQWAHDLKWGRDSGLGIGSIRRTIWQSDRWGIDFHLEVHHRIK